MCDRRGEKYKNNVSHFKIGDIVRFKDISLDKCHGEMRVVDFSIEVKYKRHEKRKKYMYNYLILVPKDFCNKCTGENDIRLFDMVHPVFESDIYTVKE